MMKTAILTITGGENFGNRLQNYALQEILKSYSETVHTIKNYTKAEAEYKKSTQFKKKIKWFIGTAAYYLPINKSLFNEWYRQKIFDKFNRSHINISPFVISKDNVPKNLAAYYDYFVSGSDQVWNPHYLFNSHVEFMDFAQKNQRVSYAASFGVDEIPDDRKEDYKRWLKEIPSISVREGQGREIIRMLADIEAEVVLDPTLLFTQKQWLKISKRPKWLKYDNYILAYYLGENSENVNQSVKEISEKYNLPVIRMNQKGLKKEYSTSPEEFLYLMAHCNLLCTDSFHGIIFGYQMNKPVVIYDRALMAGEVSMNSRMATIQELLGVEHRGIHNLDINNCKELFNCDYTNSNKRIEKERLKAHAFIKRALRV